MTSYYGRLMSCYGLLGRLSEREDRQMFRPSSDLAPRVSGREHNRRRNDDRGRKYDADIAHTVQACCDYNDAQPYGTRYQWSSDYIAGNWPPHYPVPSTLLKIGDTFIDNDIVAFVKSLSAEYRELVADADYDGLRWKWC